ncbi:MAG: hypothetical protein ACFCD0_12875 [Gemmataceae bacterium]
MKMKSSRVTFWARWTVLALGLCCTLFSSTEVSSARGQTFPMVATPAEFEPPQPILRLDDNDVLRIKLAWLGDPQTFPYHLQLQGSSSGIRITGYVPNEAIKARAMMIAKAVSGLPVQDGMLLMPNMSHRIPQSTTIEAMREQGWQALAQAAPQTWRGLRLGVDEKGRFALSGWVSTGPEKWRLCQALKNVSGCRCVICQLRVGQDSARRAPGQQLQAPSSLTQRVPTNLKSHRQLTKGSATIPLPRWKTPTTSLHTVTKTPTTALRNTRWSVPKEVITEKTVTTPRATRRGMGEWKKLDLATIAKSSRDSEPAADPTKPPARSPKDSKSTKPPVWKSVITQLPTNGPDSPPGKQKIFTLVKSTSGAGEHPGQKITVVSRTVGAERPYLPGPKALEDVVPDFETGPEWTTVDQKGTIKSSRVARKKSGPPKSGAKAGSVKSARGRTKAMTTAPTNKGQIMNLRPTTRVAHVSRSELPKGRERLVPQPTKITQVGHVSTTRKDQEQTRLVPIPVDATPKNQTTIVARTSNDKTQVGKRWTPVTDTRASSKPTVAQPQTNSARTLEVPSHIIDVVVQTCGTDVNNLDLRLTSDPQGRRHQILHIGFTAPSEAIARRVGGRLGQISELRKYRMKFKVDLAH